MAMLVKYRFKPSNDWFSQSLFDYLSAALS